eukprot:3128289-Pleurochrysis_carterae.AAC.3
MVLEQSIMMLVAAVTLSHRSLWRLSAAWLAMLACCCLLAAASPAFSVMRGFFLTHSRLRRQLHPLQPTMPSLISLALHSAVARQILVLAD